MNENSSNIESFLSLEELERIHNQLVHYNYKIIDSSTIEFTANETIEIDGTDIQGLENVIDIGYIYKFQYNQSETTLTVDFICDASQKDVNWTWNYNNHNVITIEGSIESTIFDYLDDTSEIQDADHDAVESLRKYMEEDDNYDYEPEMADLY